MSCFITLATILSGASRMFFSGGEWIPEAVPGRAMYDTWDASDKELRVTTNVQAAVASCYSGLLERSLYTGWYDESIWNLLKTEESRRTSDFPYGIPEKLDALKVGENRKIGTARLTDSLDTLRDELRNVPAEDRWVYCRWGSTQWPTSDSLPTWDWTSDDMLASIGADAWSNFQLQFSSCPTDGVWKVDGPVRHSSVDGVLSFFVWPGSENEWSFDRELREVVATNSSSVTCYDILRERLGTNAVRFADTSRRITYHKLGSIETAIRSMDRTFDGTMTKRPFYFLDLNYYHMLSHHSETEQVEVTLDFERRKMTVSQIDGPQWKTRDIINVTTNDNSCVEYSNPLFLLNGDTPKPSMFVSVKSDIAITKDILDAMFSNHDFSEVPGIDLSVSGRTVLLNPLYPQPQDGSATIVLPQNPFYRQMSVGVSRGTRVGYTTGRLVTNEVDIVYHPCEMAWQERMPRVDLYTGEMRLLATNHCVNIDRIINDGGYYYEDITNRGISVESRLRRPKESCNTTNLLLNAWNGERMAHHADTSSLLYDYLGCSLQNPSALLPIPDDIVGGMRPEAEKVTSGNLSISLRIFRIAVVSHNPDGSWTVRYESGLSDYTEATVSEDSPLVVGELGIEYAGYPKEIELEGRHPCGAQGSIEPFFDIKWKFKNLYEEE